MCRVSKLIAFNEDCLKNLLTLVDISRNDLTGNPVISPQTVDISTTPTFLKSILWNLFEIETIQTSHTYKKETYRQHNKIIIGTSAEIEERKHQYKKAKINNDHVSKYRKKILQQKIAAKINLCQSHFLIRSTHLSIVKGTINC